MTFEPVGIARTPQHETGMNLDPSKVHEKQITESLQCAKDSILSLLSTIAREGKYDDSHILLESAQEVERIITRIQDLKRVCEPPVIRITPPSKSQSLPYYYVDKDADKLIKVGKSRDVGTYEHPVPHEHFDSVIHRLIKMAQAGIRQFETQRLVDQCPMPKHQPLIILNVLERCNLVTSPSRGQWRFVNPDRFSSAVEGLWTRLQGHRL